MRSNATYYVFYNMGSSSSQVDKGTFADEQEARNAFYALFNLPARDHVWENLYLTVEYTDENGKSQYEELIHKKGL